jgi:hypothetical protein
MSATTTQDRIATMAAKMVAFSIKGRKVTAAEKVALMGEALDYATALVAKQDAAA